MCDVDTTNDFQVREAHKTKRERRRIWLSRKTVIPGVYLRGTINKSYWNARQWLLFPSPGMTIRKMVTGVPPSPCFLVLSFGMPSCCSCSFFSFLHLFSSSSSSEFSSSSHPCLLLEVICEVSGICSFPPSSCLTSILWMFLRSPGTPPLNLCLLTLRCNQRTSCVKNNSNTWGIRQQSPDKRKKKTWLKLKRRKKQVHCPEEKKYWFCFIGVSDNISFHFSCHLMHTLIQADFTTTL